MYRINSLEKLDSLSVDGVFKVSRIKWWIEKYQRLYLKTKERESAKHLYIFDGNLVRLPIRFNKLSDEDQFIEAYEKINELIGLHRDELYFKDELEFYHSIKNDFARVVEWIKKNEFLGSTKYVCFLTDYFGDNDEFLEDIEISLFDDKTIRVNRKDFKYTVDFIHLFDDLYWKRKI